MIFAAVFATRSWLVASTLMYSLTPSLVLTKIKTPIEMKNAGRNIAVILTARGTLVISVFKRNLKPK